MTPEHFIQKALHATNVSSTETIQNLWSGYGDIIRYSVVGSEVANRVILKSIRLSEVKHHPRGWSTQHSHQRKLKSYQVESYWYQEWSVLCGPKVRVPSLLAHAHTEHTIFLLLEDLDEKGYKRRCTSLRVTDAQVVLQWLANFHAQFLHIEREVRDEQWPQGLWPRGTYWHLATRPDEWNSMPSGELKASATAIDTMLDEASYQTLVHGDAKVANFCFSENLRTVAAVDFQYVGRGIGVQDVAYFLGSCLHESDLSDSLDELLDCYFSHLFKALQDAGHSLCVLQGVEIEWRQLFPVAWADFHRFLLGWSPSHKKLTDFSQTMTTEALALVSKVI